MRSWSFSMGSLCRSFARGRAAFRLGADAPGLRAVFRHASGGELVEDPLQFLRIEVLVEVVVDLHHRRVRAAAETLDLDQREQAVLGGLLEADAELLLAGLGHLVCPAQPAWRGAADLQVILPDRLQ